MDGPTATEVAQFYFTIWIQGYCPDITDLMVSFALPSLASQDALEVMGSTLYHISSGITLMHCNGKW